jgi:hypothetical protein
MTSFESAEQTPHIFLCHASGDKPKVRRLYRRLRNEGFSIWFNEVNLLPGQDWQLEIPKAIRASNVIIVCLSRISISKTGYLQKEIQVALDEADQQPEGAIFIIPLRLDECDVPERLRRWHWVDLFERQGYTKLLGTLKARINTLQGNKATRNRANPAKVWLGSLQIYEFLGMLLAVAALIVALLNWLVPFNPLGPSPLSSNSSTILAQSTVTSVTTVNPVASTEAIPATLGVTSTTNKQTSSPSQTLDDALPLWLTTLRKTFITPGQGLAGVYVGELESRVLLTLGPTEAVPVTDSSNNILLYALKYEYEGLFLRIFTAPDTRRVISIQLGDSDYNKNHFIPLLTQGVTIGNSASELVNALGEPLEKDFHYSCPAPYMRTTTYWYHGISFWICSNDLVYLILIP